MMSHDHRILGLPARRVGPRSLELFDGPFDGLADGRFPVRINARTTLEVAGAEVLEDRLGDGRLEPGLEEALAHRAKLRSVEGGYAGHFHLPVYYVADHAGGVDYLMLFACGEWDPGRYLLQLEGVWKVRAGEAKAKVEEPRYLNPPIRLAVASETPKQPWWLRLRLGRDRKGTLRF